MAKFIIRSSFTMLAVWLALGAGVAHAQDYPSRPITVINSFAPGGNADIVLRLVAARLSTDLGQPVVVDNRPGANGVIAADAVARARPDGYTLLLVSGAYPTLVATSKSLPFDPVQGFSWISMLITYPLAIAVPADSPFKTLSDLVAAAKAAPGRLNYSSAGVGSLFHLATESFESSASIDMTHVPYKGGAAPLTELLSGSRLDLTFNTLSVVEPIMKAGRVRVLAMTSATRSPLLPDVPVVAESYPGYEASSFLGIAGPAGMAPAVIERLNQALHRVLATPEMRQRFADLGGTPLPDSPEHMRRVIQSETARWKDIVATKKIDIQ
ncbi:tripartite tricarboxylate transporter substrate binding protein [Pigmentiphaga sp. GD03639]|uniref:Bug family tripartite tricarboxylate transporter substrate binding protein n=1 Tax=Pigmentiphaga sp. GD03639 TaxID=2975354 RepID=UPI00244BBAAD|nr:tripartite tricarboxylate transporter substrate binding protein [Pigmentiphaga sp. GD03639]MDH2238458.1 tripartite tricarboxylate transporter substrate binding protein [Pigmentiphaga sp. GD03639]